MVGRLANGSYAQLRTNFVLPLTRTDRRIPLHIPIDPPEGGVVARSFILCDAIRSIAKDRLGPRP
ncbi:type II toxin-antitoxin system PemK/MazF family toxin [Chloroflexus sp.]|uniref:type II toxin-antitoxin system PemK/MazF family toxin n=1 Tax=Chloroflexus sp. TaxID=1904827 RepID=UPI002ACD3E7D|nr:type II toxin-antitoxin system PemK/MazF family toxin [Chloroflexus sp.]